MSYIEVSAKTLDDAITEALIKLEVTSDQLEYEVIEKGSNGFLGFGSKQAKIKVRVRPLEEVAIEEIVRKDKIEELKEVSDQVPGIKVNVSEINDYVIGFLKDVFKAMGMEVEISTKYEETNKSIEVDFKGNEMGVLIGKRGQTLDSLQYLCNLAVNNKFKNIDKSSHIRVKLDTENYRKRRKETLENLARNIAYKVKRTKHSVALEPMNPFERRIIHASLQNDKYVTTHSEGEEPFRHVVVTIRK